MVEYNSADYVTYLRNVFHDDPAFVAAAEDWGMEERQHGQALGRWSALADPSFDFEPRFAMFREGFRPDVDATERSEEHTSELQSLMRNSYAVFCLKKKKHNDYVYHIGIMNHKIHITP